MQKIEPLKLTVNGKELTLGVIGFRVYIEATKKIREYKEEAFSRVVGNITRDPLSSSTMAASAVDGYMAGMIVGDYEIRQWLFSPEGEMFLVDYSARKANPDITTDEIEQFYDDMSVDDRQAMGQFFSRCLLKDRYKEPEPAKEG